VRGVQKAASEIKDRLRTLLAGSDTAAKQKGVTSINEVLAYLRGEARRTKGLSAPQAADVNAQIDSLAGFGDRLRASVTRDQTAVARKAERAQVAERREAQTAKAKRIKEEAKAASVKEAAGEGRTEKAENDTRKQGEKFEFASPTEKRRLTANEALREARDLAAGVRKAITERAKQKKIDLHEEAKEDRRGIAVRDTDAGKESRSSTVTKKGDVKQGKDTIGAMARRLKAGKEKLVPFAEVPQGRKIANAADVQAWEAKRKKGDIHLQVGDPIPGTEYSRGGGDTLTGFSTHGRGRGSIPPRPEVLGDVIEGIRRGAGAGKTIPSKEGQIGTEPPVPEIPEAVKTKRAEVKTALDRQKRLAELLALRRARVGSKPQPRPSGAPSLTEGPVTKGAAVAIPKRFQRKGLEDLAGATKKAYEAERQVTIGKELIAPKRAGSPAELLNKAIADGRISRTSAMELRGKTRAQLEEFIADKTAEALAYKGANVAKKLADPDAYDKGRRKHIEKYVQDALEGLDLWEDQLHAAGRLHTTAQEMSSRKKYKGSYRNLIEDLIDGREIDIEEEYYINPRERANLRKIAEERIGREYDMEMAESNEEAPYAVRPDLAARLGSRAPQAPQTMPEGGRSNLRRKGRAPVEDEAARLIREAKGEAPPAAPTPASTSFVKSRYPTLEAWANAARPERLLKQAPMKAQMGATKPGTKGTEGGDVEGAMARAASGNIGSSLFAKDSSTGKMAKGGAPEFDVAPEGLTTKDMGQWIAEKRAESKKKIQERKATAKDFKLSHAQGERLLPRLAEGLRQPSAAIKDFGNIKNLIGKIARETVGKGAAGQEEFIRRVDDLITKRVNMGDILPGEAPGKVRQAALRRFGRERANAETPRETAERVLGGSKEQLESASPTMGRKKRADAGDIFAQAGEEAWAGKPMNETAVRQTKLLTKVEEASGITKNAITGFDISAVFRNTLGLTARQMGSDPKGFVRNFVKGVASYSEKHYDKYMDQLNAEPLLQEALDSGLRLSMKTTEHDIFANTDRLAGWVKAGQKFGKLNPVKWVAEVGDKGMLGAARAYTMYQNAVMMDTFKAGIQSLHAQKELNPSSIREMNTVINMLASRHKVTFLKGDIERFANTTIFSPQMITSAVKTLVNLGIPAEVGPRWMRGGRQFDSVAARKMYQQSLRSTMAFGGSVLALTYFGAKSAGLNPEIETDILSSDYGTVRFGHNKVNPWGPYQQYIRLGAQILAGKEKLRGSGRTQQANPVTLLSRVARGKLSPLAGLTFSGLTGKTGAGRDTRTWGGLGRAALESAIPINPSDVWKIYNENPAMMATLLTAMVTSGINVTSGTGTKSWITTGAQSETDVRVNDEIRKHMLEPPRFSSRVPLRGKNAVGQKLYYSLSGTEREKFANEVMPIISADIDKFIASDRYKDAPEATQKRLLFRVIKRENARYSAAKRLKKTYAGATPVNDWWKENQ
jgi:hypothetical protein